MVFCMIMWPLDRPFSHVLLSEGVLENWLLTTWSNIKVTCQFPNTTYNVAMIVLLLVPLLIINNNNNNNNNKILI